MPELGLYYYKARMYSPTIGRFMQTDPIGYNDGMNMYAYVGGDPVNWVDPSGTIAHTFSCYIGDDYMGSWVEDIEDPNGVPNEDEKAKAEAHCESMRNSESHFNAGSLVGGSGGYGVSNSGLLSRGVATAPQNDEEEACSTPLFARALTHDDFSSTLREAMRVSRERGNIETGFNYGRYLTGSDGFGDVYRGYPSSIIFRTGVDSLFMDGMPNPSIYFHIHPPGTETSLSAFDKAFARRENAMVVAFTSDGVRCFDGRQ